EHPLELLAADDLVAGNALVDVAPDGGVAHPRGVGVDLTLLPLDAVLLPHVAHAVVQCGPVLGRIALAHDALLLRVSCSGPARRRQRFAGPSCCQFSSGSAFLFRLPFAFPSAFSGFASSAASGSS